MVIIIIIAVVAFLWWSLTPKSSTPVNSEQRFKTYVMRVMMNTVEINAKQAPVKQMQGIFVLGGLNGCKEHFEKNSFKLSKQYNLPEAKILTIIHDSYKYMVDTCIT